MRASLRVITTDARFANKRFEDIERGAVLRGHTRLHCCRMQFDGEDLSGCEGVAVAVFHQLRKHFALSHLRGFLSWSLTGLISADLIGRPRGARFRPFLFGLRDRYAENKRPIPDARNIAGVA